LSFVVVRGVGPTNYEGATKVQYRKKYKPVGMLKFTSKAEMYYASLVRKLSEARCSCRRTIVRPGYHRRPVRCGLRLEANLRLPQHSTCEESTYSWKLQ